MDIGRCLNEALEVYKKNFWQLVLGALVFQVLAMVSLSVLIGPLAGGWCLLTINALRRPDKRVEFGDLFAVFNQFGSLVGLFYLTFIPILLGTILCVVPGMILMTLWLFAFFLIVDRKEGVFSSLAISQEMVGRNFGKYVVLVIIVTSISLVPSMIPYVGVVIGWFVMPIAWLIEASAYLQEVDEKSPVNTVEK
jgi:uncharacterized membrane protein